MVELFNYTIADYQKGEDFCEMEVKLFSDIDEDSEMTIEEEGGHLNNKRCYNVLRLLITRVLLAAEILIKTHIAKQGWDKRRREGPCALGTVWRGTHW